jgi:hypothetical protein
LIINSGEWPAALGQAFLQEYSAVKVARLLAKRTAKMVKLKLAELQKELDDCADTIRGEIAELEAQLLELTTDDGGMKIQLNGTFGKTGSPFSILFAPQMLMQTTLTGQLSLLMLIEWLEHYCIPVVSANTDGLVVKCPRDKLAVYDYLIEEWQRRTGLEMETEDYIAIYARDVNNYFAVKTPDDVKRKGEYGKAGLNEKKNPDCEICSDAVADYLAKGVPIEYSIAACRDVRKFVTIQRVSGGAVKLWGEGPRKGALVRDMLGTLQANGWIKEGRQWRRGDLLTNAATAYEQCFAPQRREYLGKVIRWYYGTRSPGSIVYASNGNTVGMSYGAQPCMTLPDQFPDDIDYSWYLAKARQILVDIGK